MNRDTVRAADDSPLLSRIRASVIGDDHVMDGPFGPRRVTNADYTASGRATQNKRQQTEPEHQPSPQEEHVDFPWGVRDVGQWPRTHSDYRHEPGR